MAELGLVRLQGGWVSGINKLLRAYTDLSQEGWGMFYLFVYVVDLAMTRPYPSFLCWAESIMLRLPYQGSDEGEGQEAEY